MNRLSIIFVLGLIASAAAIGAAVAAPSVIKTAKMAAGADAADPASVAWHKAPATEIALVTAPAMHPSIAGTSSVANVSIQALTDRKQIFFRLSWADPTAETARADSGRFLDAVALQFPLGKPQDTAVLMGNAGKRVNIWYWRADGKVQNLFADGFGTLYPVAVQDVSGKAVYRNGRWHVVLTRALKSASGDAIQLKAPGRIAIAPAVWNGANSERDGFKAVTMEWQSLVLTGR